MILLWEYNADKKENLDQVAEEIKQKVSVKTQRLSRYWKRQNQYIKIKCLEQIAVTRKSKW
jgi:hypothetical protein